MLAAGITAGAPQTAMADSLEKAKIKSMSFTTKSIVGETIHVVSTDKKKWNAIKPGSVKFSGHMKIDTKSHFFAHGWVDAVGVLLGICEISGCNGKPTLWTGIPVTKDYDNERVFMLHTSQIPVSTNGIAAIPYGDQMIAQCNQHLTALGPTKKHEFTYVMHATFAADTSVATSPMTPLNAGSSTTGGSWNYFADHSKSAPFTVKVVCDPVEPETAEDVPDDPNYAVSDVKLFLSTFQNQVTKPNIGTECKKGRILVRHKTTKAGPVKFRLWTKLGNQPTQVQVVEAWSSKHGSEYKAEFAKWVETSKTQKLHAKVKDLTHNNGQEVTWKDITLKCSAPGGMGLADQPKPQPDAPVQIPLEVTGEVTLADQAGAPKDKPRVGQAVFKIWANKPGSTTYRLVCSGGRDWSGTLPTNKIAKGKYQAVGAHNLQITKAEQISCTLWSKSLSPQRVIATASKLFPMSTVNPNPGGNTIADRPRPTHDKPSSKVPNKRPNVIVTPKPPKRPKKPAIKVAPKPQLVCINGRVSRSNCFCPPRTVKKKIGTNAYRCDRAVAQPKRVIPKVPPKRIITNAPPQRIITRVPPKRVAPVRVPPKRVAPKRAAPRTAAPAVRNLRRRVR
ncbi:MAG: hypothetical protein MPJ78_10350 [Hyphomicrobiaceae bacterium]|nr:hypothetical protein [Hyphomicrobiaceae bacterium]